jgi:hypothetical protein
MIEQEKMIKRIKRMNPHPQPLQEQPRPNPKLSWSQSNNQLRKNNFNKPDKQPGRSSMVPPN